MTKQNEKNANSWIFRSLLYPSLENFSFLSRLDPWQFIGKSLPFTKLPNPSKEAAPKLAVKLVGGV